MTSLGQRLAATVNYEALHQERETSVYCRDKYVDLVNYISLLLSLRKVEGSSRSGDVEGFISFRKLDFEERARLTRVFNFVRFEEYLLKAHYNPITKTWNAEELTEIQTKLPEEIVEVDGQCYLRCLHFYL